MRIYRPLAVRNRSGTSIPISVPRTLSCPCVTSSVPQLIRLAHIPPRNERRKQLPVDSLALAKPHNHPAQPSRRRQLLSFSTVAESLLQDETIRDAGENRQHRFLGRRADPTSGQLPTASLPCP